MRVLARGHSSRVLHRDVAPGIHRLDHAFTNAYLVEDGDRLTLVDTLFPRSWDRFERAVKEIGRSLQDVQAILLTHAHFDHVGFARRAREQLGVPVWAHEKELPVLRHPWRYEHEHSRVRHAPNPLHAAILAKMSLAGAPWVKGMEGARLFEHGQTLDVAGGPTVIGCPGHTYGHVAFHFPERDALIAGDALVTLDPYTARRGPRIVSGAATADTAMALGPALDALAPTRAAIVMVGHGDPITGGIESAVEQAREAGPA